MNTFENHYKYLVRKDLIMRFQYDDISQIPNLSKIIITIEMHIIEAIKTKIFLINIILFTPNLFKKSSPLVSFKGEDKKHNCFISLIYFSYFLRIKL